MIDFDPGNISGLSSEEAGKKLISEGYNELTSSKRRHPFHDPDHECSIFPATVPLRENRNY